MYSRFPVPERYKSQPRDGLGSTREPVMNTLLTYFSTTYLLNYFPPNTHSPITKVTSDVTGLVCPVFLTQFLKPEMEGVFSLH